MSRNQYCTKYSDNTMDKLSRLVAIEAGMRKRAVALQPAIQKVPLAIQKGLQGVKGAFYNQLGNAAGNLAAVGTGVRNTGRGLQNTWKAYNSLFDKMSPGGKALDPYAASLAPGHDWHNTIQDIGTGLQNTVKNMKPAYMKKVNN